MTKQALKLTVRTLHGTNDWFLGKEYNKAAYSHPVYSTYSQNVVVQLLSHV